MHMLFTVSLQTFLKIYYGMMMCNNQSINQSIEQTGRLRLHFYTWLSSAILSPPKLVALFKADFEKDTFMVKQNRVSSSQQISL